MDLLIVLTYAAICIAIFKIKITKWSVPTAILGGIVLISTLILLMNYNHPYSEASRHYFVTTPIVPTIKGKVVSVPITGGQKLKAGDVLFKIDPEPFQDQLDIVNAKLKVAKLHLKRNQNMISQGAGVQADLEDAIARVDTLEAEQRIAQFNLDESVVRAPTDGYATQVFIRPGMMAVTLPTRPSMIFIHDEDFLHIGWFRQNSTLRLTAGSEAEVAFDSIPGEVFTGEVLMVIGGVAEGQLSASGSLLKVTKESAQPGRVPILIKITDPAFKKYAEKLPGGAFGQAAIYSEHFEHVAIMRKMVLRMSSWMNYLFPFH
jgi:multidrug resistance efflux pump